MKLLITSPQTHEVTMVHKERTLCNFESLSLRGKILDRQQRWCGFVIRATRYWICNPTALSNFNIYQTFFARIISCGAV